MKLQLGTKYYKILEDKTVNVIRLYEINEKEYIFKDESNGNKVILNDEELDEYVSLNPDAIMAFNIVELPQDMKDVVVTMYRTKYEIKNNDKLPYAVCRQNIYDVFTNTTNDNESIMYIGLSINKDSMDESIEMEALLSCEDVNKTDIISAYMDDTLFSILSLIDETEYDSTLESMKVIADSSVDITFKGSCSNLEELLKENNFMFDFRTGFDIKIVNFEVKTIQDTDTLIPEQAILLEKLLGVTLVMTSVYKYDKSINLSKLKEDYVLVSDTLESLYIITYDSIILDTQHFNSPDDILEYLKNI